MKIYNLVYLYCFIKKCFKSQKKGFYNLFFIFSYNKKYNFLRITSVRRKRSPLPHSPSRFCFTERKKKIPIFCCLQMSWEGNRKAFLFFPKLPRLRAKSVYNIKTCRSYSPCNLQV